jgi:hypothetical protein
MLYEVQLTDQILSPSPGNDDRMQSTTDDEKSYRLGSERTRTSTERENTMERCKDERENAQIDR